MNTWIMIAVIGHFVSFGGLNSGFMPAMTTATFADREACEQAIVATRKLAARVLPRVGDNVQAVCVPSASDLPK